jgi:SAM-dependent methyltransferase
MIQTIFPAFAKHAGARLADGLVLLPSESTVEANDIREKLDRLNRIARDDGWQTALQRVWDANEGDYVTSDARLGFLDALPLAPDQALLEIGASLGQIAIPLARRVRSFDGLEVVAGQAAFCLERARQEGLNNVRITAGGADCLLPYADESFDGVVLNLVLEWCADRTGDDHETMQRRLLGEIRRVLKPGGFFYLNTKNRYALRLIFGGGDEHMHGMRWGSALPRPIARLLAKSRPRGKLHSHSHLARMLRDAGFGRIDGYWAIPEMRKPVELIPFDGPELRARRRAGKIAQGPSRKTRLAMALLPDRLVKFFTPGLTFIAYR